jgi:hypothetical protein
MRRILILSGVLGGGTALTFIAAAIAATMFPSGPLVYQQPEMFWTKPMPMPVEMVAPGGFRGVDLPANGGVIVGDGPEFAPGG